MRPSMERWALKLVYDEDNPIMVKQNKELVRERPIVSEPVWKYKDDYYDEREDTWQLMDEKFYVLQMLHQEGALTHRQIMTKYNADDQVDKEVVYIKSKDYSDLEV